MTWATDFHFTVEKPATDKFAPTGGWGSVSPPVSPWSVGTDQPKVQAYQSDENLKKQYGIELAKTSNAFEAACKIFGEEASKALWVSFNWLTDPIVVASRDIYAKTVALSTPLLDKEQLAAKVLALADEKILKNGVMTPVIEAKDRIAALKLYSDIAGYTGKVEIDSSTNINNTIKELTIKLVKAEEKKPVTIDNAPNKNVKSEILNTENTPITLKLVGGAAR
jgi:hypothetical protein